MADFTESDYTAMHSYLDPDDREIWIKVGMADKSGGVPFSVWDSWSKGSSKYKSGECAMKWAGFKNDGGITIATLIQLAKDAGWKAPRKNNDPEAWIRYIEETTKEKYVCHYDYIDLGGKYHHTKVRTLKPDGDKHFIQGWLRDGRFTFSGRKHPLSAKGTVFCRSVSSIRKSIEAGEKILVCEGEKDVVTLQKKGFPALTSGAADSWSDEISPLLDGADVVILADNDGPGKRSAVKIKKSLEGHAKSTKIILPSNEKKGDVTDYFEAGGTIEELQQMIDGPEAELPEDKLGEDQTAGSDLILTSLATVEEKEPDWLVSGLISKGSIATLAAEGGAGKTTIICSIAAAISRGDPTFLERIPEGWGKRDPGKIFLFSGEDSLEYTLKRRLRKNNANLENIFSIDIADDRFQHVKFGDPFLEQILEANKPDLCVFDPIQAFVPPDIHMGDRNAMRNCLAPLIGYGSQFGTTFIIVVHSNKQAGVYGRKRIADSADIWDISRSVLMVGETSEKGIRYVSNEKNNYAPLAKTTLFRLSDEQIQYTGTTDKRDKDFVTEQTYTQQQAPARNEAEDFILEYLGDGEKPVAELDEAANAMSISKRTLQRAKSELKTAGKLKYRSTGQGKDKQFFVSLIPIATENLA